MNVFKVGDLIERTGKNYAGIFTGQQMTVSKVGQSSVYREGDSQAYDHVFFKLITPAKIIKDSTTAMATKKYDFIIHDVRQMDSDAVHENLTEDSPVALIVRTVKDKTFCTAIYHKSIRIKAKIMTINPPTVDKISDFGKVTEFVRKVKEAKWNAPKQTVAVTIPKLF